MEPIVDFAIVEQCFEFDSCDAMPPSPRQAKQCWRSSTTWHRNSSAMMRRGSGLARCSMIPRSRAEERRVVDPRCAGCTSPRQGVGDDGEGVEYARKF